MADSYFYASRGFPLDKTKAEKFAKIGLEKGDKTSQEVLFALLGGDSGVEVQNVLLLELVKIEPPPLCELLNKLKKANLDPKNFKISQFNKLNNQCGKSLAAHVLSKFATLYSKTYSDNESAVNLRAKACVLGSDQDCLTVGMEYLLQEPSEEALALRYFKEGYKLGNAEAAYQCWKIARQTWGGNPDIKLAKKCQKMAIENSHVSATLEWAEKEFGEFWNTPGKTSACEKLKALLDNPKVSPKDQSIISKLIKKGSEC